MYLVISDGDVIVEVAMSAEQPWITAWRADDGTSKRATFNLGDFYEFDELHHAARKIVDGIRPQLHPTNGVDK